jgi:hypothetical protein
MRLSEVYFDKEWLVMGHPLVNKQKAIENGPVEIVDLPMKNGDCPVRFLYVYQRVNPIKSAMNLWSNLHETIEVSLMLKQHNLFKIDFPSRTR